MTLCTTPSKDPTLSRVAYPSHVPPSHPNSPQNGWRQVTSAPVLQSTCQNRWTYIITRRYLPHEIVSNNGHFLLRPNHVSAVFIEGGFRALFFRSFPLSTCSVFCGSDPLFLDFYARLPPRPPPSLPTPSFVHQYRHSTWRYRHERPTCKISFRTLGTSAKNCSAKITPTTPKLPAVMPLFGFNFSSASNSLPPDPTRFWGLRGEVGKVHDRIGLARRMDFDEKRRGEERRM